eukprot:2461886-Prymnesium_polylepis.1
MTRWSCTAPRACPAPCLCAATNPHTARWDLHGGCGPDSRGSSRGDSRGSSRGGVQPVSELMGSASPLP